MTTHDELIEKHKNYPEISDKCRECVNLNFWSNKCDKGLSPKDCKKFDQMPKIDGLYEMLDDIGLI